MMLTRYMAPLTRRFITLEEGWSGRLVGEGDPSSISIEGDRGKPAVLALHGFAGTPNELRIVTDAAQRLHLFARAPRLSGHGADARELLNVGWNDWVEGATAELFDLSERAEARVVVCGLSLGALLATHLAATYPERVAGLIALANAVWLRLFPSGLPLMLFEAWKPLDNRFFVPKTGADIRDPEARKRHLTYDVNPIRSAVEVLRSGDLVRSELANVKCPTLVVHGRLDRVCSVGNAFRFAKRLGTTDVEVAIMPNSGHIVSVDLDRHDVSFRIEAFLRRVMTE